MTIDPNTVRDLDPGTRLLMGPGPSNVSARVLQAMSAPCIGHLDPYFLSVMDETQGLLRFLFQTENPLTIPVSGTGSAGMETCFVNLVEPGDEVVVCIHGVFGTRMADIVQRIGGNLITVEGEWGRAIDPEAVRKAIKGRSPKLLAIVHAETSTGVCQGLEEIAGIAHEAGALFLVDMVTSLGGMEVTVDKTGIDAVYSGTQKCLSCPPGLAPISFNSSAMDILENRKSPVVSWYLDMSMVKSYWGTERKYHHTAPINMIYAFREALRIIAEEGLEARFARHKLNHKAFVAGIEAMGLTMLVPQSERLPMLNTIRIPEGADDTKVRRALLKDFGIEIGGGLGALQGKIWRVGLMGHTSHRKNVVLFLAALETILKAEGVSIKGGALEAASEVYGES
ncbi:MAG: alanine--glyoxylate aminotransferase family protein [Deltaproteobacteria bacterium]|nr:alanine--glyoxylate aminotransferase family protein [Deltaproteobacteria bacterium]MBW2076608.1 alanine--glyoxylate aminotransferase family protein [Deltaproteobacteria bacterium]